MSAVLKSRYTPLEYVALERTAQHKSEYYRGEIFAMVGGSPRHNDIAGNIYHALRNLLAGRNCRPYQSDQRIRVNPAGLHTYPDVSIVGGPLELDEVDRDAVTNPRIVFEVLSKSTESYDRGKKFELYRGMDSLAEYILVSQEEPHVERLVRQSDSSWRLTEAKGLAESIELTTIACRLTLAESYDNVVFETSE